MTQATRETFRAAFSALATNRGTKLKRIFPSAYFFYREFPVFSIIWNELCFFKW
jgi:hypothetical protein